jgi:hypothetical protein
LLNSISVPNDAKEESEQWYFLNNVVIGVVLGGGLGAEIQICPTAHALLGFIKRANIKIEAFSTF